MESREMWNVEEGLGLHATCVPAQVFVGSKRRTATESPTDQERPGVHSTITPTATTHSRSSTKALLLLSSWKYQQTQLRALKISASQLPLRSA